MNYKEKEMFEVVIGLQQRLMKKTKFDSVDDDIEIGKERGPKRGCEQQY